MLQPASESSLGNVAEESFAWREDRAESGMEILKGLIEDIVD